MPKSAQRIEAEKLCKQFPKTANRTLAKRLSESHQITLETARSCIRTVRGNHGDAKRKCATEPRPNGKAGTKPEMPPSQAEAWLPFELGNGIKVAVISDLHVPYHSPIALNGAVAYCKKRRPDVLFINGDLADFYSISRHQKDPSKRNLKREFESIRQCLGWLRGEFPKTRIVLKAGNHEERWQHWLWNSAPEISDMERMSLAQWVDAEKYGIEVVTDQRPVMAGLLPIMHGHEIGKGISAPVNTARGLFLRVGASMLQAHSHRTSQHTEPDWTHREVTCWSQGCLCDMNPEYARVTKWNHGFVIVDVNESGGYNLDNLRINEQGEIW